MPADNRLAQLWQRRDGLNEAEWDELYRLVCVILKRSFPSILRSLPESKEHYIQDFFLLKVFEPARRQSASPHGPNELCSYFNNYLIDVYRSADLRITDLVGDHEEIERNCEKARAPAESLDKEFFEYNMDYAEVHRRARRFLGDLDEIARLYLALHACSDAPEPLYKLAEHYRIPSYHYRARQLGITRKKGEFGEGYETTQIGRWLTMELGLDVAPSPAVLAALKILCLESLQQYQQPRGQDA